VRRNARLVLCLAVVFGLVLAPATSAGPRGAKADAYVRAALPYGAELAAAARRQRLDPLLLAGLVQVESGFDADAVSSAGAGGLTQLMPATARSVGVRHLFDPRQNLQGGAYYLRLMINRAGGNVRIALAAYNVGPAAVTRPALRRIGLGYAAKVLAYRDAFARAAATSAPAGRAPADRPAAPSPAGRAPQRPDPDVWVPGDFAGAEEDADGDGLIDG
jgi:soluble lytic murein transglycosylase-like protein